MHILLRNNLIFNAKYLLSCHHKFAILQKNVIWNFFLELDKELRKNVDFGRIECHSLDTWHGTQKKNKQILAQQPFLVRAFPFGISRQICFFYEVGLSDQCPQPLLHEGKPWLIWDSNSGPLGIKLAMLPTEPLRSSRNDPLEN
jgi:hypothetical protein